MLNAPFVPGSDFSSAHSVAVVPTVAAGASVVDAVCTAGAVWLGRWQHHEGWILTHLDGGLWREEGGEEGGGEGRGKGGGRGGGGGEGRRGGGRRGGGRRGGGRRGGGRRGGEGRGGEGRRGGGRRGGEEGRGEEEGSWENAR